MNPPSERLPNHVHSPAPARIFGSAILQSLERLSSVQMRRVTQDLARQMGSQSMKVVPPATFLQTKSLSNRGGEAGGSSSLSPLRITLE